MSEYNVLPSRPREQIELTLDEILTELRALNILLRDLVVTIEKREQDHEAEYSQRTEI